MGRTEPPPGRQATAPASDLSQFPPSSARASSAMPAPSPLPERPRAPAPPPPTGGFAILQDSISSFPLYMGGDDGYSARRAASSSAAIPIGNPVGAPVRAAEPDLRSRLGAILLTTTDSVQGRLVEEYLGPVNAEVVVPAQQFLEGSETHGAMSRHKVAQHRIRQYNQLAFAELRLEADKIGGNAVLAATMQVMETQGVLVISAFGTAVRLA